MTATSADAVPTTTSPLQVEELPIADLHPDPGNPRRIGEDELAALTRSIATFGVVDPVLARRADRRVIAGHQRLVAARRAGLTTVPVILLDLPVEDARLLNVALNQIGGEWDADLLARLLIDLRATAARDLTLSGFADGAIWPTCSPASTSGRNGPGRSGSTSRRPSLTYDREASGIAPGAGWQLGAHRLFRGDATDAAFVARCLGDGPAALVFTDPPYNVALRRPWWEGRPTRPPGASINDAMPAEEWERFCRAWAASLTANVAGALYVCMSSKEWPLVCPGAGRGRGALVGHDHLGQGPLHAGPGRLSAPVRADLVRLAGGAPAALGRRARPGRRLADPAPRRLAAAPHPEAAGTGRAGDRALQPPRRHGPGPLLWRGHDADRLRTHRALRRRDRDRPALRGGHDRALGGVHGRGRRAPGTEGGGRWLVVPPARH